MKGVFLKLEQGWVIEYIDNHLERNFISLHPSDHITNKTQRVDGKEVEFEIVHLSTDPLGRNVKPYAKLVDKLGNKDVPKLGYDDHISDISKMVEDDVEKLAAEWIDKNSHKWSNNTDEVGDNYGSFVAGYNKAKENTYTEEQMIDLLKFVIESKSGLTSEEFRKASYSFMVKKFIQSLKQPKKD